MRVFIERFEKNTNFYYFLLLRNKKLIRMYLRLAACAATGTDVQKNSLRCAAAIFYKGEGHVAVKTEQNQTQRLALNRQLQLSLQLLAMGSGQLLETVSEELGRNPALTGDIYSLPLLPAGQAALENLAGAGGVSLTEELEGQLGAERRPVDHKLAKQLIALLDENGYLRVPAGAVARAAGVSEQRVRATLEILRSYEPAGVFAFDLADCLLLQVQRRADAPSLAAEVIRHGLGELGSGDLAALAERLSATAAQVEEAAAYIRTLQPKPGAAFYSGEPQYVRPDLEVVCEEGQLIVRELRSWRLELCRDYAHAARRLEPEARAYLKQETARARRLLLAVEQRSSTLLRVARAAVERQEGWFLENAPLEVLSQAELAHQLRVSESTVCRAVKEKYFSWAGRAVPLRELFCTGLAGGVSASRVQACMRRLLEKEDSQKPYSDAALAAALAEQGILAGRRTLAKYRLQMGIPAANQRKRHRRMQ